MKNHRVGRLLAASSAESADLLYASGFQAPDEFVYAEIDGKKMAVMSILELERARREARRDVEIIDRMDLLRDAPPGERNVLLQLGRRFGVSRWRVPERFPVAYADRLEQAGFEVEVVSGAFFPERAVKSETEIAAIRLSMKAVQEAEEQTRDFLKESKINSRNELEWRGRVLTCEYVRSEIEAEFKRKGFSASGTIISCGTDSAIPHCIGSGPIRAGEPVVADIFPRSDRTGYWGDMTRTFVKGKASKRLLAMFESVKRAGELALKHLKPGVPGILIHELAAGSMREDGFPTGHDPQGRPCGFIHGLGHGVGLEIHEEPRLSPANREPLQAGNVVSVEPGLYYPEFGGVRLEDLVVLTKDGFENFCTMPKELEIP